MNQPQPGTIESIAIAAIRPSTTNPRKTFDEAALQELAASIAAQGVVQPVLVRPLFDQDDGDPTDEFELVTGERRLRAAKIAGLKEIPAYVRELSDADALDIQIVENLQRADLHPVEEAEGYRELMARGASPEDVAKKAGKSLAYVQQRLKLLTLELPVKQVFHEGHLSLDHALVLARLQPADQDKALRQLLRAEGDHKKLSTADVIAARKKNIETNQWAKHNRLIDMTAGALREWVTENVMLALSKAPWNLEDGALVPEAGACTTCPKRTGSNTALFQDLTVDQDVCLDAACFATKQKAFVQITANKAVEAGAPLLQLSAKKWASQNRCADRCES